MDAEVYKLRLYNDKGFMVIEKEYPNATTEADIAYDFVSFPDTSAFRVSILAEDHGETVYAESDLVCIFKVPYIKEVLLFERKTI